MSIKTRGIAVLGASALVLTACTGPDGQVREESVGGGVLGGILGAGLGAIISKDKSKGAKIGGVIGAAAGVAIGNDLAKQEEALQAAVGNSGVRIVNTGSELILTLPEAITFDVGSAFVRGSSREIIFDVARNLQEFPNTSVNVTGHTDNTGTTSYNQKLSQDRAESVSDLLANAGVDRGRIATFGAGENQPVASNLTLDGRQANRRVEITITPTSNI